jgi:predicted PP-loop superfamily ATPase
MKVPMRRLTGRSLPRCSRLDPVFGARENLKEAVAMVLQANREFAEESLRGVEVVREPRH